MLGEPYGTIAGIMYLDRITICVLGIAHVKQEEHNAAQGVMQCTS